MPKRGRVSPKEAAMIVSTFAIDRASAETDAAAIRATWRRLRMRGQGRDERTIRKAIAGGYTPGQVVPKPVRLALLRVKGQQAIEEIDFVIGPNERVLSLVALNCGQEAWVTAPGTLVIAGAQSSEWRTGAGAPDDWVRQVDFGE